MQYIHGHGHRHGEIYILVDNIGTSLYMLHTYIIQRNRNMYMGCVGGGAVGRGSAAFTFHTDCMHPVHNGTPREVTRAEITFG